jgi:hypothetical protein
VIVEQYMIISKENVREDNFYTPIKMENLLIDLLMGAMMGVTHKMNRHHAKFVNLTILNHHHVQSSKKNR